jgi:hypothetical protein
VGAGYVGNSCVLRIRNSWGTKWEDGGYLNVPVERLVKSLRTDETNLTWITPESSGENAGTDPLYGRKASVRQVMEKADESYSFVGLQRLRIKGDVDMGRDLAAVRIQSVTGSYTRNGTTSKYRDGKRYYITHYPLKENGVITGWFTGDVDPNTGTLLKGTFTTLDNQVEPYPRKVGR